MEKRDPELQVTIKKLVTLTLLEVFKDLLPSYQLKLDQYDGVKCKSTNSSVLVRIIVNNFVLYFYF